ncbi:tripartite tricarboxylate transporter TctB family protein [Fusibacter ferrireducens]|uniref:Tripartite tricarboxylate transporter TctB family protein n=1 Tax=Fusibacter ferrireducens TaxID=2785058 RepID=A0ABR9ZYQ7_9FIRM|nr:tripartite tricarboxylate transporter TctB family protein [Fusibacter ferrireducens]MBF4695298.1 tripartite tricarboxylate transporter TctB family protein [Fusibacter ferrireducens]
MENNKKTTNYDFLTGIISVVVGIIYGVLSYNIKRSPMGNPLAPSMFPLILAACMIIFGVILILKSDLESTKRAFQKSKEMATENDRHSQRMIAATVVASLVYALILERFGYVISTVIFMMAMLTITNGQKWVKNSIVALLFSGIVYYIFFYLLGISLPMTPFINL